MENVNENWFDTYRAAMQKQQYDKATEAYQELPAIRKMFTAAPHDPSPETTAESLAQKYVQQFNAAYSIGQRKDFPNGESLQITMNYNTESLQPVLVMTYYDGACAFQERKAFESDGTKKDWPIEYPYSEFGITGRQTDLSHSANQDTIAQRYILYDQLTDVVGQSLQTGKARSIKNVLQPLERTIHKETSEELYNIIQKNLPTQQQAEGFSFKQGTHMEQEGLYVQPFKTTSNNGEELGESQFIPFHDCRIDTVYTLQFMNYDAQNDKLVTEQHLFPCVQDAIAYYYEKSEPTVFDGSIISGKINYAEAVYNSNIDIDHLRTALNKAMLTGDTDSYVQGVIKDTFPLKVTELPETAARQYDFSYGPILKEQVKLDLTPMKKEEQKESQQQDNSIRYGETPITPTKDKELFDFIDRHLQNDKQRDGLYAFVTNENDQDGLHIESFHKQGKEAIRNNDETFVPFWKLQPEKVYALSIETQQVEHLKQGEETAPVNDHHLFLTKNAAKGFYQDSKDVFDDETITIGRIISGKVEDKALVTDNDTIASLVKTALAYVDGNVSQKEQLDIVRHEGWHINNAIADNIFNGSVFVKDSSFELLPKLSSSYADIYYGQNFQAGRNEISIKELAEELNFTCDTKDKLGLKELTYRLHTENDNPAELAEPAYLVEQNFTLKINEPYNAKINSFDLQVDKIINDNHFSTIEKKGNSVDDFIQLMVNYGSYEAVKAIEMRRPEIETKRIFDYETASILHRTGLQSDFAEKYGFSRETMQAFSKHMDAAIDTQNPNAGLYVSFPYVEVNKDYNLEGHKYVTFGGVDSDRKYKSDMVDKTNLTITSEFYSKNGNAVDGSINTIAKNASVWLATNAEKGNDVNTIIFANSAVDAMSVAEMKKVDLEHTAIVSVGKFAKEEQIKGVLELFPKAEIHTAYKNSLFGELSAIRTAAAINNTDAKISITDDNKIRIFSNDKTDVFTAQKGMAEKYIMAHNLTEKLPTQNIHRPNGHTFNDDLKAGYKMPEMRQEKSEENHNRGMKI